ncbi:MAG TPA: hypothetical protein VD994_03700 [Prosthecobacter sp.]|nr:hypothetical protein [Prosthecobacter sp.]
MAEGELQLEQPAAAPAAEDAPPMEDLLPTLPEPLRGLGKALIQALREGHQVQQVFSAFCSAAYVKPDWAGAASEFLAELFAEQEDLLAEMARIPDLIIELATGHITLTCMVASRWAARAETPRLARLAEALIATQSKMSGDGVVEVMLALATSLAITRYSRAEQLLAAAEPHATQEQQEALAEARLWLAAGRIVRSCTQEARDLWDQRLRRSSQAWTWLAREEREALLQLADHLTDNAEGAQLFKAVVPRCWWDLATLRVREDGSPGVAALPPPTEPLTPPSRPPVPAPEIERDFAPSLRASLMPFLGGITIGALAATAIFLVAQPRRWSSKVEQQATAAASTVGAATPGSETTEPQQAPAAPEVAPQEEWRKKEVQALAAEIPELEATAASVRGGTWESQRSLLQGESSVAPLATPAHQKLLLWMHLDPPVDPELRSKIPGLLADLRRDDMLLDLWKRLVYPGSPNAEDIRAAAKQQIHRNSETKEWNEAQVRTLEEIAGWSVTRTE